jgi:GTPase SAR1 family protein
MGDGFILVFSLTDKHSFEEIKKIKEQIVEAKDTESIACVIVGNKKDLVDKRAVSAEEANAFAKSIGSTFVDTSAVRLLLGIIACLMQRRKPARMLTKCSLKLVRLQTCITMRSDYNVCSPIAVRQCRAKSPK